MFRVRFPKSYRVEWWFRNPGIATAVHEKFSTYPGPYRLGKAKKVAQSLRAEFPNEATDFFIVFDNRTGASVWGAQGAYRGV